MAVGAALVCAAAGIRVGGVGFSSRDFIGVEFAAVFLGGIVLITLGVVVLLVRERLRVADKERRLTQVHEMRLEANRAANEQALPLARRSQMQRTTPGGISLTAITTGAVHRNTHRIVVRDFSTARIALGRLRHELEHARQYDRCPDVYLAMGFIQSTIARAFGQLDLPCLDGSAALYNVLPHEEDANRAAARLTEAHLGPPSDGDLTGTDAPLFRNNLPVEEATLARRLLATAALFPSAFEWVAQERGETVQDLLGRFGPDSEVAWGTLDDLPEIAGFGRRALDSSPTEGEIRNAAAPAVAWTPPKEAVEVGREAAESALAEAMPNLRLN